MTEQGQAGVREGKKRVQHRGTETGRTRCMGGAKTAVGTYGESENRQSSTSLKEASNPEVTKPLQERTKVPMSEDKGWSSAHAELWNKGEESND